MIQKQPVFLRDYPAGIYRIIFDCTLDRELTLPLDIQERYQRNLGLILSDPERGYIETPKLFFERWLNGRCSGEPTLCSYYSGLGFELQIPLLRTEQLGSASFFGRIEGFALASDFGYTSDFKGSLVFAINDIFTERTLVYREGEEKIKIEPLAKKDLKPQRRYGFPDGPENYPFSSLNPSKSLDYTWSLVNISPEEVYQALRDIGFEW